MACAYFFFVERMFELFVLMSFEFFKPWWTNQDFSHTKNGSPVAWNFLNGWAYWMHFYGYIWSECFELGTNFINHCSSSKNWYGLFGSRTYFKERPRWLCYIFLSQLSLVEIVASMTFLRMTFWISSLNRSHLWRKFQVHHRSSSTSLEQRSTVTKVKTRHVNTEISSSFIAETFSPYKTMTKIQCASRNNISYRHKKGAPINPSSLRSARFVIEPD